jgi:protein-tyrosine phosphatase
MHHRIRIEDAPAGVDLLIELPSACNFIHAMLSCGGRVLVHSVRGQNRAAAVVTAYRKWVRLHLR